MKSISRPKKDKPASDTGATKFNRVVEIGRERKYVPAGDREQFNECIAAARARCTHPAMAAWLPRLDALEARTATAFT